MMVPNESIEELAEETILPGVWVREWAAGRGAKQGKSTVRAGLVGCLVNRVNLDVLPRPGRLRSNHARAGTAEWALSA